MPTYCYSTEDGDVFERYFPMAEMQSEITLDDGRIAKIDFSAQCLKRRSTRWEPLECIASGVHASQAGELRDFFRKHGENVTVTADGNPVYTSPGQRKRLLKLRGLHDRNSF